MKQTIALSVLPREAGKNVKHMRKAGNVPAVIYGNTSKNAMVVCNAKEFNQVYARAGENTLVDVELDGKKVPCLIHSVTFDPVTSAYEHIDFYAVDMNKKVTTHVPVVFEGEAPAVKNMGGVLLNVHSQLEVTCLPKDIPASFIVNLSKLENLRESITVANLKVPEGVTINAAPDTAIVIVQEPRKEEVIEVVAAPVEGAEGAAAGAEGAPAAAGAPGAAPAAGAKDAKGAPAAAGKDAKGAPAKK